MHQVWNDRFDFARPKLFESYLKGELRIHLQFRVQFGEFDSQSYCAVWFGPQQSISPLFGDNPSDYSIAHCTAEMDFLWGVSCADDYGKELVLVGIVEVVNDHQGAVVGRASPISVVVGLNALDDGLGASGDALHYSPFSGHFKFLRSEADRELGLEVGSLMTGKDKRPSEMIQAGSQMMDDLAN